MSFGVTMNKANDEVVIDDLEWPTFGNGEAEMSYSPTEHRDSIFTDFTPATEKHNIKNKKRKPKKKSKTLRLISESDVNRNKSSCFRDRKRCVVISVLVTCIVIIVLISICLGVYFGIPKQSSNDGPHTDKAVQVSTHSPSTESPAVVTSRPPIIIVPITSPPRPPTTTRAKPSPSPVKTTTTTSTTTTTTTTKTTTKTTTTTTTTTPLPTKPPVIPFTGSDEEVAAVKERAASCRKPMVTADMCTLYFDTLRCTYLENIRHELHVPVHVLGEVVDAHAGYVFPWDEINTNICREKDGSLKLRNISALPTTMDEICASADAILETGSRDCKIVYYPDRLKLLTEENNCMIRWGVLGCVADLLLCELAEVEATAAMYSDAITPSLHLTANPTTCQALRTERQETSPCAAALDRKLFSISNQCSVVLESPGTLANITGNKCTMFEVFYQCSYNYIPSSLRYAECERQHTESRQVAYNNVAKVASNVNNVPKLLDFTDCLDRPMVTPGDVCSSPDKLLAIVDTRCYRKFRLLTDSNVCQILSEFVYECSPLVLGQLGITCADDSVMHALTTLSDVIKQAYYFDVGKLQAENEGKCIDKSRLQQAETL